MSQDADLIAYDPDGQIAMVAEIKSRTHTSREWATRLRRNILAHGLSPSSQFWMLALPDRLYLWKGVGNDPEMVEPTYEFDATAWFKPYFRKARILPGDMNDQGFELIVMSWLTHLMRGNGSADIHTGALHELEESGLIDALRGGTVALAMPA